MAGAELQIARDVGVGQVDVANNGGVQRDIADGGRSGEHGAFKIGRGLRGDGTDIGVAGGPKDVGGDFVGVLKFDRFDRDVEGVGIGQADKVELTDVGAVEIPVAQVAEEGAIDLEAGVLGKLAGDLDRDFVTIGINEVERFENLGATGETGEKQAALERFEFRSRRGSSSEVTRGAFAESSERGFETVTEVGGGLFHW